MMMPKNTLLLAILLLCTGFSALAQPDDAVRNYIDIYKQLAIEEQMRSGVPAAITLAQGIHESTAGQSDLALRGNNHFGIKCKSTWTGDTVLHDDDKRQECFRKYISPEQSYIDHSDFLRGSNRYSFLFDLEVTDYIGWASGLKRAGYATNPLYVRKLTDLVEKYNLQQYTYEALRKKMSTPVGEVIPERDRNASPNFTQAEDPSNTYKGLRGFWVKPGENLVEKALMNNIRYERLLELNDLQDAPLEGDMFLFLEKKRKTGTVEFHTVKDGETMQFISQKEAMQLQTLYAFNNMKPGEEPETGEQLTLQYKSYGTPRLKPGTAVVQESAPAVADTPAAKTTQAPVTAETPAAVPAETQAPAETKTPDTKAAESQPSAAAENKTPESKPAEPQTPVAAESKPAAETRPEEKATAETKPVAAPKTDTVTKVVSNPAILDLEKARRTAALLGDGKVEEHVVVKAEVPKPETPVVATPPPAPVKKERPAAPKRTYNEVGVSDTTKQLKEKFDQIVYRPLPERKKAETPAPVPAPQKKEELNPKPAAGQQVKAKDNAKTKTKAAAKTEAKPENKNTGVEKTSTGLVREVKKDSVKKYEAKKTEAKDAKASAAKKGKEPAKASAKDSKKPAAKPTPKKGEKAKTDSKKPAPKKKTAR